MRHRSGKTNVTNDASSRKRHLQVVMINELVGFEQTKSEYVYDPYLGSIYAILSRQDHIGLYSFKDFFLVDGFLLKGFQRCIPLDQGEKTL